ncbi:MAG TPA: SAM-dependent methyltransferase, partial [Polyangiaceae bacterium]
MTRPRLVGLSVISLSALLAACATQGAPPEPAAAPTPAPEPAPILVTSSREPATTPEPATASDSAIEQAVGAQDRSLEDRALDVQRKPVQLLEFFGISAGQRVGELGAGGGYMAELLARVVGPSGKVYGQNSKFILERFAEAPWSARLAKPIMQNVVRLDTP